jgi:hypothetical protein
LKVFPIFTSEPLLVDSVVDYIPFQGLLGVRGERQKQVCDPQRSAGS